MPAAAARLPLPEPSKPLALSRPRMPSAEALTPYLERMDEAGWYSNFGPLLQTFEARLADRLSGGAGVVTVSSATTALTLTLQALDLPPGSVCAVPAWTFVATAHAVLAAGLTPWFVDVDARTGMLDPAQTEAVLAEAPAPVRVVMPVLAHGAPVDLDAWAAFRDRTGVAVIVDAAAAFDALSSAPVPAVVSLHATKALGVGEGGYVASTDAALLSRVRRLTAFGFDGDRVARMPAQNAKLSEYAAAVGLAALDGWTTSRQRYVHVARAWRVALMDRPDIRFQPDWGLDWVSSVCVVDLPGPVAGAVATAMAGEGVPTRAWWSRGCHREPAFAEVGAAALQATDRLAASTLGLPYAAAMDDAEVARAASALMRAIDAQN